MRELQDLDSGIIPLGLLDIFAKNLNVELSASAQAEDQYHYSWLITDQGSAYLSRRWRQKNRENTSSRFLTPSWI